MHVRGKWKSAAARRVVEMAGDAATIEEAIARLANQFLAQVSCPPTDLDDLRSKLNVELAESSDVVGSGALMKEGARYKIVYAADLSPQRRRFTIAHELGHVIVDAAGPGIPRTGKELERLCDMFASEILMPKRVFLESASSGVSIKDVFRLARSFQTSLTSTAIRYAQLRRVSVFEVDGPDVVWGRGIILKGKIRLLDEALRELIQEALNGQAGAETLHLNINSDLRLWRVEYHPYGKSRRALILMYPPGRGAQFPSGDRSEAGGT